MAGGTGAASGKPGNLRASSSISSVCSSSRSALAARPHQVPRLIVAVHEALGQRSDLVAQILKTALEHALFPRRERPGQRFEPPFAEVVELPAHKGAVEAPLEGDALARLTLLA